MAESLTLTPGADKRTRYTELLPQLGALLGGERDAVANMANAAAALHGAFGWLWVGFYRVQGRELVLGPFQGPVACTRIGFGRGVCGTAWRNESTIVVPDVSCFPDHIACSTLARSEIVVPILRNGQVVGVLDADSEQLDAFDEVDVEYLEQVARIMARSWS